MLLAQSVLVASSVLEPHTAQVRVTHVDEPGTRHLDVHNEATCVVCSTRAMHVDVPSGGEWLTQLARRDGSTATAWQFPAWRATATSNPSRAPPV